jgi:acetyltransferase-like isoleucine patch superfamily enzyme
MAPGEILQRTVRRAMLFPWPGGFIRKSYLQMLGARIGRGTRVSRCRVSWPHQLMIGEKCILEQHIYFKFDWYWTPGPNIVIGNRVFIGRGVEFNIQAGIQIGDDCLIASGCVFVDHDHGMDLGQPMRSQPPKILPIEVGNNVWIGANAVLLKGINIGEGAVVGAGSVVTKSIPTNEIWCGNPAKKMGDRKTLKMHETRFSK